MFKIHISATVKKKGLANFFIFIFKLLNAETQVK